MLVRMPQTLTVTEHFQLGRFGEVLLSVRRPPPAADQRRRARRRPASALQAANDLNQIILDDASKAQNPDPIVFGRGGQPLSATNTLRGGDTITGVTGRHDVHVGRRLGQPQRLPDPPGQRPRRQLRLHGREPAPGRGPTSAATSGSRR